jgi:hypothetical protein
MGGATTKVTGQVEPSNADSHFFLFFCRYVCVQSRIDSALWLIGTSALC